MWFSVPCPHLWCLDKEEEAAFTRRSVGKQLMEIEMQVKRNDIRALAGVRLNFSLIWSI